MFLSEFRRQRAVDKELLTIVKNPEKGTSVSSEPPFHFHRRFHLPALQFLEREWWNQQTLRTKRETVSLKDKNRLKEITKSIRKGQRNFLDSTAQKYTSAEDFLNDPLISPDVRNPESGLDLSLQIQDNKLKFTISCLAPKSENPRKTDTQLPDIGELSLLIHFEELANVLQDKFGKDVEFLLLTEGHYTQEVLGFDPNAVKKFNDAIVYLSQEIVQNKRVKLIDWYDEIASLPEYQATFQHHKAELTQKWKRFQQNFPGPGGIFVWPDMGAIYEFLIKFQTDFGSELPTVYQTIAPAENSPWSLFQIYRLRRSKPTHQHIQKSMDKVINLVAFNKARKEIHAYERLHPDYTYGSLTPGPGKKGFYALFPHAGRYPNHGVGILDTNFDTVEIFQVKTLKPARRGHFTRFIFSQ